MSKDNNQTNSFVKVGNIGWGLLGGAFSLFILGLFLAYIPKFFNLQPNSYWFNVCTTLSSAFVASGVLTLTLEFANNYQRKQDIDRAIREIQSATTDNILKELIGSDEILNEVKTHIIKQNFIRKDFNVAINLQWAIEESFTFLLKRQLDSSYSIWNLTSQELDYLFRIVETKDIEAVYSNFTKIIEITYRIKDEKGKTLKIEPYSQTMIEAFAKNIEDSITIELPIKIPVGCYAEFKFTTQSFLKPDTFDPIISLSSTQNMEIDLVYPSNIKVSALGIHPDPKKFELEIDQGTRKRWRANGLLPGQGIMIYLKSIPSQALPEGGIQNIVKELLENANLKEKSSDDK